MLNEEQEPGTKKFVDDFNLFEEFIQQQDTAYKPEIDPEQMSEPETPEALQMKYLLKIDERQSEQSDRENSSRAARRARV